MERLFSLKREKGTGELHLFESTITNPEFTSVDSVCCKMKDYHQEDNDIFTLETEDSARNLCCIEGKAVCGTCVSTLYTNDKPKIGFVGE